MGVRWRSLCQGKAFSVEGDAVLVALADNRTHRVHVEDREADLLLTSTAVTKVHLERSGVRAVRIWEMNRALNMVGFRVDERGRLVGETWLPKEGLEAEEFRFALRNLASECDRFEYLLTGKDLF